MAKFRLLHQLLQEQGLARAEQFVQPLPAPRRWL
ncbi:MAG: hypothetical protein RLZZ459_1437, partial [Cyanobacteriota bacterium]